MVSARTARPTVVVVGSLNADLLLDVDRLPRPGETVTARRATRVWGGKGANQAVAAAALGARTFFVGAVGRDSRGTEGLADLERSGVDTSGVARVDAPTGKAHVLREPSGENMIVVVPGANDALEGGHVRDALDRLERTDVVVVSNLEITDAAVSAAAAACSERGWEFVLNPGPARRLSPELLAKVSVLTPNAEEVSQLGAPSAQDLLATGLGALVVTRGAAGVDVHAGGRVVRVPAFPVHVVDTVGAGDAFTAGLAVGLAAGDSLEAAARLGTASAAIAVTGAGARGARITMAAARALVSASVRARGSAG